MRFSTARIRLRLAAVRAALTGLSPSGSDDRSTWERAWERFARTSLVGIGDARAETQARECCFADACTLLSSPHFADLGVERRTATVLALHDTLMSAPSRDLAIVADLGLRQFRNLLSDPELRVHQAMGLFDALHSMFFSGVTDVLDLRRFDAIVPLFEAWLSSRSGPGEQTANRFAGNKVLTVAYLLHTAHFDRGNAVSPLVVLLANVHSKAPDRRVLLYLVQHVSPDFIARVGDAGFAIRSFPQDRSYARIGEIAAALREDEVDVVITEQNRAVATALFSRRVAPLQIWLDTGFPYWNLKALDWTLSPTATGAPDAESRKSGLFVHQPAAALRSAADQFEVDRIRGGFPKGAFVLAVFARLVKLNDGVFDLLDGLLSAEPHFHLLIAGTGDAADVREFVHRSMYAARIRVINENVNLSVYGRAVDAMCDTFPFIGGHACREVGAHGTPVVSMLGTPWDAVLREERSPDLLAHDRDSYIALVRRLFHDREFRDRQRQVALAVFADRSDPARTIADIESGIAAAGLHSRAARQARKP